MELDTETNKENISVNRDDIFGIFQKIKNSTAYLSDLPKNALHASTRNTDRCMVEALLDIGVDINGILTDGSTALSTAVCIGALDIVDLLLSRGASVILFYDVDDGGPRKYTIMHMAVLNGNDKMVELLLQKGMSPNSQNIDGTTPLHLASREGQEKIIEILLAHGADVERKDKDGFTPLLVSAQKGHEKVFNILLGYDSDVNIKTNDDKTALCYAIEKKCASMVDDILKCNPDSSHITKEMLYKAVEIFGDDHKDTVKSLIEYTVYVHFKYTNDNELLFPCIRYGCDNIVDNYLSQNGDPSAICSCANDWTLLHIAAMYGRTEIAKSLIKYGADINSEDKTKRKPIHYATVGGHVKIVKELLRKMPMTADLAPTLYAAIENNHPEIVKYFVNYGIDVNTMSAHSTNCYTRQKKKVRSCQTSACRGKGKHTPTITAINVVLNSEDPKPSTEILTTLLEEGGRAEFGLGDDKAILRCLSILQTLFAYDVNFAIVPYGTFSFCPPDVCECVVLYVAKEAGTDVDFDTSDSVHPALHAMYLYLRTLPVGCKLAQFYTRCVEEVQVLKRTNIVGGLCFFDFMTRDLNELLAFAKDDDVLNVFNGNAYKETFPLYAGILEDRFKRLLVKRQFKDLSIQSLLYFINYSVPEDIVINIISYLSRRELRKLITACQESTELEE